MNQTETLRTATAGRHGGHPRRHRRRHRLAGQELSACSRAIPTSPSPPRPVRKPPARRARLPALARIWDGTVVPLDPDAAGRAADAVFLALPEAASAELAPALLAAGAARDRSVGRVPPARRRRPREVVSGDQGAAGRRRLRPDRVRARRRSAGASLLSNPGCYPTASLLACCRCSGRAAPRRRRHRHRREVGHLGRGQGADRSHALLGEPRQRGGLQPVRPSPHAGDGAGARPRRDVRAAPGAARSRHPLEHLRAPRAGHDARRRCARRSSGATPMRRLCG